MANRGRWSRNTQYRAGDIATVSGRAWVALVDNSNVIPGTNSSVWGVQTSSTTGSNTQRQAGGERGGFPQWDIGTFYQPLDIVSYQNQLWQSEVQNIAQLPSATSQFWSLYTTTPTRTVSQPRRVVNQAQTRPPTPTYPQMYVCSPRLPNQKINTPEGEEKDFREQFIRESRIPFTKISYLYWMLEDKRWWPQNGQYVPSTVADLNSTLFAGVNLVDPRGAIEPNATSFFAEVIRFHDDRIFSRGECIPEDDILVFDFELPAIFYTLQNDMLRRYRFDSYDENGNVDPNGIHRPPFDENGNGIYYNPASVYQVNDAELDLFHYAIINAYKTMAAFCRRRYGFKKVGNYGLGGFQGWWHGLRSRSLGLPNETVFDDDRITSINPNYTYRKWMKWSWRRILQRWENYGLFTESSPGAGDYLDKVVCLPKQDVVNRQWGWPNYDITGRGFEEVVSEMVDAYRPWKDKSLLMVNNYYSINGMDCSGISQWDQASRLVGNDPINANYRSATETPPQDTNVNDVNAPLKLKKELDSVLPIYFKHAPDWDICDFNFYWVDFDRWTEYSSTSSSYQNARTRYWLAGYDGNYQPSDTYTFLFQKVWVPWYKKLSRRPTAGPTRG